MIAVFVAGALDLFVAALLASGVMLATGCLTQNAARASVNWAVITTIAGAFGISACLENTGVANAIATTLVGGATGVGAGTTGVFVAVYVATFFLCNVVGNNAAAALMYPIAAGASEQQGIDRDQMAFLLMLAASASFMSPFGYQTNLMVYGPGGYVFADFLRFGVPMQFVQMVVSVGVVLLGNNWWAGWVAGFGAIGASTSRGSSPRNSARGRGKETVKGRGWRRKNWRKSRRRKSPGRRWTAHAQTECCSRASCETSNAYRPPFSLLRESRLRTRACACAVHATNLVSYYSEDYSYTRSAHRVDAGDGAPVTRSRGCPCRWLRRSLVRVCFLVSGGPREASVP